MNAGMRDFSLIEEREPGEGTRKLAMMSILGLCMAGVTLAVGVLMGNATETAAQPATDPLAALAEAQSLTSSTPAEAPAQELWPVDREALTFPDSLVDDEPSLEATLAAANAELLNPDALEYEAPTADAWLARTLPASVAAAPTARTLARDAATDPVLAAALPQVAPRDVERAAPGADGPYTLQVISYRSRAEAGLFAQALRSRGHSAFVISGEVEDRGTFYRVRIGPFPNRVRAERYRATFEQEEGMNTFVYRNRSTPGAVGEH